MDDLVVEFNLWLESNPLMPTDDDGNLDYGFFNRGQKCDWVGEANKTRVWKQESKDKISQANKARGAKIYCSDLNKTWDCAKDAARDLGMNHKMIYRVAMGDRKTHKGLHFERVGQVEARK
jgi:hypothetical protein